MNVSRKRFESIIPLSREHHYALMLCLRIHRGVPKHKELTDWLREQAKKTVRFFDTSLASHFNAEETALFPAMSRIAEATTIVTNLLEEHREIQRRVEALRRTTEALLAEELLDFADLLEQHIRKEERQLFPLYEKSIPEDIDARVGHEILRLVGSAAQPEYPELLE
jgi:hemerythrin-like domain-containing protein